MIKRLGHIVLSAWLAVLLFFGGTPKEFVHLFTHHQDTVHCLHADGYEGLSFDNEHHHCTFLNFTLAPFVNDAELPFVSLREAVHYSIYQQSPVDAIFQRTDATRYLRGPPIA